MRVVEFFGAVKKHFWVVNLCFLAVAAYLSSEIVSLIFLNRLGLTPIQELESHEVKYDSFSRSKTFYQPVLDRNIFNSAATDKEETDGFEPTPLHLQLKGTLAGNPGHNLAIIRDLNSRTTEIYEVGDVISDSHINKINRGTVQLVRDGESSTLHLQKLVSAKSRHSGRKTSRGKILKSGIQRKSSGNYQVDSWVVDDALGDMNKLMKQARVVPHLKNGRIDGFKIYKIKRKSLYKSIGLRNGDILHKVNGLSISGPEQALQAFNALRNERNIQLEITRHGRKKTLSYTIR